MSAEVKIDGVKELTTKLSGLKTKTEERVVVVVGYTQSYAIYVHENLESYHPNGQAKYLEQPLRERAKDLKTMVEENVKGGMTLAQALIAAGLLLQRESQKIVPVDTGALKGSAFTRQE